MRSWMSTWYGEVLCCAILTFDNKPTQKSEEKRSYEGGVALASSSATATPSKHNQVMARCTAPAAPACGCFQPQDLADEVWTSRGPPAAFPRPSRGPPAALPRPSRGPLAASQSRCLKLGASCCTLWALRAERVTLWAFRAEHYSMLASNFRQRDCESARGPRLIREILWLMKKPQTQGKRSWVVAWYRDGGLVGLPHLLVVFFQPQYLADQVWAYCGPPAASQSRCLKLNASCCTLWALRAERYALSSERYYSLISRRTQASQK